MATIELSDAAPKNDGAYGFTLANTDFELAAGESYETEDSVVLGAAGVNPWLKVVYPPAPTQTEAPGYDPNDPHDNPAADHLSPLGSPEVKQAADEADAAIQRAAFPNDPTADDTAEADVVLDKAEVAKETKVVADPVPDPAPTTAGVTN